MYFYKIVLLGDFILDRKTKSNKNIPSETNQKV